MQPWFVRRRYGFGYRPLAWQGWAIAAALIGLAIVVVVLVHTSAVRIAVALALVAVYTAVGWRLSGERPEAGEAIEEAPAPEAREPAQLTSEQTAAIAASCGRSVDTVPAPRNSRG